MEPPKKIDAICNACKKPILPKDVSKCLPQPESGGGYIMEHRCADGGLPSSCLVWKEADGVWRKKNP